MALAFLTSNAHVYVDGLNLYYGALKGTPYKWLDLGRLCKFLLPRDEIARINYYTAMVVAHPDDRDAPTRQGFYLRALRTIPNLSIYYGHFLTQARYLPLASPLPGGPTKVRVLKDEEKGSDVNLATHLVRDGFRGAFEVAVVISNDSDLLEPIRVVRYELGLPIGILNPHKKPSRALSPHVTFFKQIRPGHLKRSQFPSILTDNVGTFTKPRSW